MDKRGKAPKKAKPQRSEPTLNKAGWAAAPANDETKKASAVLGRKPIAKGAIRGR